MLEEQMAEQRSASSRVLLTVELAEHVLSYLAFQDLIRAERVCRSWRDILAWSPSVRQGLFLEPGANHLSMAYQSNTKLRKPWQYRSLNVKRYTETYTIAVLHPYLLNLPEKEGTGKIAFSLDWRKAFKLDPNGRWRKMYVTQPPCRNVKIEFQVGMPHALFTGRDRVSDPAGVRLGLIVDRVRDLLDRPNDRAELQPVPTATVDPDADDDNSEGTRSRAWFERLDCYVDGFISEEAAVSLASKAAAAAAAALLAAT